MIQPNSPDPIHSWEPGYTPAFVSNGVVGLRVCPIPLLSGVTTVNGFVGMDRETGVEGFAQTPYPLAGDLRINGVSLSQSPERATLREQRYDFSCGELHTRFHFDGDGAGAEVNSVMFCSRTRPPVVVHRLQFHVDQDCQLEIAAGLDPQGVLGRWLEPPRCPPDHVRNIDCVTQWGSHGDMGSLGLAYGTDFRGTDQAVRRFSEQTGGQTFTTYAVRAEAGRRYELRQFTSLVPDAWHERPLHEAARLLTAAVSAGGDDLRADNRRAWEELWCGRPTLVGAPPQWQGIIDAAFFYLHSSANRSAPASTHLFGLSSWPDYHYYRGHVMWDVPAFAVPPLLLSSPESARSLITYRYAKLCGAFANAAARGYTGAQFPWESSPSKGEEAAPVEVPHSYTEEHVSMDVALEFANYVHATGDRGFAADFAWPVMSSVARWLDSRVEHTARGYELRGVNGIAETETTVDNNAFVNCSAVLALRETVALGRSLGQTVDEHWESIADHLVLPIDPETRVIRNHDRHDPCEDKGETPEGAAVLFPLGYPVDAETERATLEFHLRSADRYVGAPMLSPMLGVYAAWLGDRGRAYELFERGYASFVVPPFAMATEFSPARYPDKPRAVPFTANLGGMLAACYYGLCGMRLNDGDPATWCERSIMMPCVGESIHVERMWVRGRPAALTAEDGAERARITFL
ncbi:Trehalose and maltose hydrolase (possible phosphorylase) [Micromonospora pattaloongensis]|uniref:Trehalose and maltose hydrolase (Possible phosphorylase) n=1 Tax=Micromonospora pattaloongensis TaxID=405436 RepID=A0A1H3QUC6_9ACTN|nr:glycoside hydrolase family 65 protein [Micromonospora pattaloongensis]SDZ17192.1 Trehalose and maltose hydrolase (possible phosphorylase) [Micromonospora pattaloongensis]